MQSDYILNNCSKHGTRNDLNEVKLEKLKIVIEMVEWYKSRY